MRVGEERENHLNMFGMIELDFCVNHLVNAFLCLLLEAFSGQKKSKMQLK